MIIPGEFECCVKSVTYFRTGFVIAVTAIPTGKVVCLADRTGKACLVPYNKPKNLNVSSA